ncbi:MAG: amino acid transport protein [Acidobacteria bacterium]|nr:amino acid transport protein [Acidobacteriota bacterium]
MTLNLDPTWLFLSLIPGGIGFVLFVYGKKQGRWPQMAAGLVFMVYPYFTPGIPALLGVGVLIGAVLWMAVRLGW